MRGFVGAAAALLLLAACGKGSGTVQPTETTAQAVQRVEELVEEAFARIPAGATLQFNDGTDRMPCDDPTDNGPKGRIFVEKRYKVVPSAAGAWPADQAIPALVAFWAERGYRLHDDGRDRRDPKYVVETPDGYMVIVKGWNRGDHYDYTLTGSSPCIWANGTPDPQ
ncbi:hypothetical protein Aut01nite_28230 [Actinoplanes utahensis]|nr:hypothetical protein Aut01nite_28230 [Actinoplanes utahensis]